MAAITTNDLKNGMTLDLDSSLFQVVDFQHVKPGKGHAFVRTTLRNSRTGAVVEKTFRAGEKVQRAMIDKRQRAFQRGARTGADEHTIDEATVVGLADAFLQGLVRRPGLVRPESTGRLEPRCLDIDRKDPCRAIGPRRLDLQHTRNTGADDQHGIVLADAGQTLAS